MQRGPASTEIGTASCPLCHRPIIVKTNKYGWPTTHCDGCRTQIMPRSEEASLFLLGRIYTWSNPEAAAALIEPGDQGALRTSVTLIPPSLPPHLKTSPAPLPTPTKPKRTSLWDRPLA